MSNKLYDIVVFGATGYTGRLIAKHLIDGYASGGLKIAIAGRDQAKLSEVRSTIGAPDDTAIISADSSDRSSLVSMAERTKVIISAVGPYQKYGSELVSVCAELGVDYLDLSGESLWMQQMIKLHHATAQKTGARILHSCGFDSIPFEAGVWFTQKLAEAKFGRPASRVKGRVRTVKGSLSGGTVASGNNSRKLIADDPSLLNILLDPFALTPGFKGPNQPDGSKPQNDEDFGPVAPFVMAAINTKNVHRSNLLQGHRYGADFLYDEMAIVGADGPADFVFPTPANAPKPGEGPSEQEREDGSYEIEFLGLDAAGSVKASVRGKKDPGYGSTSMIIAETALCLLESGSSVAGGVLLPGAALGKALVERLDAKAGLSFRQAE